MSYLPTPRVPILGVLPRSQLQLCLRMDTASDIPPSCGTDTTAKVGGDSSPVDELALGISDQTDEVSELSRLASMHIDGSGGGALDNCVEDEIAHRVGCLDKAKQQQEEDSSHKLLDNPDSSEQNGKIPNRDSGIDSPSCAAEGEVFPNEDAIDEEGHYDSVTETESVSCCITLDNKRDSTQDEDSDLDEGSSGEIHSLTDTQMGYLTDAHSEANKVSNPACLSSAGHTHKHKHESRNLKSGSKTFTLCGNFQKFTFSTSCKLKSFISDSLSCNGKSNLCLLLSHLG